jgi:hypothetical protein
MMYSGMNTGMRALVCSLLAGAGALGCSAGGSSGQAGPAVVDPPAGGAGAATEPPPPVVMMNPPLTGPGVDDGVIFSPGDVPLATDTPTRAAPRHRGLLGKQVACDGAQTTSVSGTVYIPSGELPLYNVMVYVPETELSPLTSGASCSCEVSGEPIVSTLTDASGHFVLENVPVAPELPLVIQVGDWRREFSVDNVSPCADTPVPDRTLKLPARQSEGDMPRIAVATGALDALECLVRKLGVDESEFTNQRDGGRVQLFAGLDGTERYAPELNGGAPFPPAEALWDNIASLKDYDIVLLSCEGDRDYVGNKPASALQAMYDYANLGGRLFASHYHSVWFQQGPGLFPEIATFTKENDREFLEVTGQIVTDFPKGQAMAEWVVNTGTSADGQIPIEGGAHTILQENTDYAQRWLETVDPDSVQYISANTPLGASDAEQCGRVVLSDLHVSPGPPADFSAPDIDFPAGCVTNDLSPQEAVLAFMLFDLSACIVPDNQAPVAPPIIQ